MLIRLLLIIAAALPIFAADPVPNHDNAIRYLATYAFTGLSNAAGILTISVPAESKDVYLVEAYIESTVALTAAQNLNGAVSSGTTVTPIQLNHPGTFSVGQPSVKRGATVAGGTALPSADASLVAPKYRVNIGLEHIALRRSSSAQSYSISTGLITGDATVSIVYAVGRN